MYLFIFSLWILTSSMISLFLNLYFIENMQWLFVHMYDYVDVG